VDVLLADYGSQLARLSFQSALVWRSKPGVDKTLYAWDGGSSPDDAGSQHIVYSAQLPAFDAHCGEALVLQVTQTDDAGTVVAAVPHMTIP
jgi:hypothetical protein